MPSNEVKFKALSQSECFCEKAKLLHVYFLFSPLFLNFVPNLTSIDDVNYMENLSVSGHSTCSENKIHTELFQVVYARHTVAKCIKLVQ
jgi:hypothetical protein